jgi:hypothetical protein
MRVFFIFIVGVCFFGSRRANAQFDSNLALNVSLSKEFMRFNQFSNNLMLGIDYNIGKSNRVGLNSGVILGLTDFLFLNFKNPHAINKVFPIFLDYSFVAKKNEFSLGIGTEIVGFGSNNVLSEYSYWWNGPAAEVYYFDFKIRDRMQLIVPFTYGYQFYKNLSATVGVTFYRTKCFEPDSYFDVTYFHHLTYSVGLKYRFKRKVNE